MNKIKNIAMTIVFALIIAVVFVVCIVKPPTDYSKGERRPLAQMPQLSEKTVFSGEYMSGFEKYATDQFPLRDKLRTIKALFVTEVLNKSDNNALFEAEGHLSKIDDEEDFRMIEYAATLFEGLKEKYMSGNNSNVYFSVIPDKNMFLAEKNGYPSMDYDSFINEVKLKMDFMEYIDIIPYLSLDDYYKTDTHWRQEAIVDIAKVINSTMGTDTEKTYVENKLDIPFYGVYHGQSALPVEGDRLYYLTNDVTDNFKTTYYGSGYGKEGEVYNMDKAYGRDSYEIFLSGSEPLVKIENSLGKKEKLIVFRDSFGGSLVTLLAQGYKEAYAVDIRYMQSSALGDFIDFSNSDVLFIYSTSVLNTSTSMK